MIKYALVEILRKWQWSLVFTINLSFGFIGFISLLSFQRSIEQNVQLNAKQILSADLSISARKKISASEIQRTKEVLKQLKIEVVSESFFSEFLAMLRTEAYSHIVSVKAVDSQFPLYGDLQLQSNNQKYSENKALLLDNKLIAYSELKEILHLRKNQMVKLGDLELKVEDFVLKDSTQTFKFGGIAPKVFVSSSHLNQLGLLKMGSTFNEHYLFKLKEPYDKDLLLKELYKAIPDPIIQIQTSETAAKDSARQLGFLTDFLNLIGIISILLSALGTNFLYQVFISKKIKDYAIFKTLGLGKTKIYILFFYQIIFLSLVVTFFSYLGALGFIPLLKYFFEKSLSLTMNVAIPMTILVLSFFIIVITCVLVAIPFLLSLEKMSPAKLFNEEKMNLTISFRSRVPQLLSLFLVALLSFFLTKSFYTSGIFVGVMLGITFIAMTIAFLGIKLLEAFDAKNWILKYSIKSIVRKKSSSIIIFSCICLSTLLLNILPQVKNSIKSEFIYSDSSSLPSMFIIDIQEEQIKALEDIVSKYNKTINHLSPLIRARIVKINDQPFEKKMNDSALVTREQETENRFRNRGINLTYRHSLSSTEEILEGIAFDSYKDPIPGLSIEYKYAERLGLKLNDLITFDIQGVKIVGKVINFRKVRWISFQPNFFIAFDDGVLNDAPKSYIGIINNLDSKTTSKVLSEFSDKIPNLSVIDVRELVKDVLNIADQMSFSIQLMSILTLVTGFVILISIIYLQLYDRRWEINFLKILGVSFRQLLFYILFEFNLIALMACFLGIVLSYFISYGLVTLLFETPFALEFTNSFILLFVFMVITFILCFIVSFNILKARSSILLRES